MQRGMDFTDLIDLGKKADVAAGTPLPAIVLHGIIRLIIVYNT